MVHGTGNLFRDLIVNFEEVLLCVSSLGQFLYCEYTVSILEYILKQMLKKNTKGELGWKIRIGINSPVLYTILIKNRYF